MNFRFFTLLFIAKQTRDTGFEKLIRNAPGQIFSALFHDIPQSLET